MFTKKNLYREVIFRWGTELWQALSTKIFLLHFQLTWQNYATPSFEERPLPFPIVQFPRHRPSHPAGQCGLVGLHKACMSLFPAQGIPTCWKSIGRVTLDSGAMFLFSSVVTPEWAWHGSVKAGENPVFSSQQTQGMLSWKCQGHPWGESTESSSCQLVDIPPP